MAEKSSVLDSIKSKLNQLNSTSQRKNLVWRPTKGEEAQVRIIPYKHAADPFNELYFHYNVGAVKSVLCPQQTFGGSEKCPICEYVDTLRQKPRTDQVTGILKTLSPKLRTYVPVIVRGREAEGVKFWGIGKTPYKAIATLFVDPEYGDISDVLKGRDLKIMATAPSPKDLFGTVSIRPAANASKLHEDLNQMKEWIANCPKVYDAFEPHSYDELKKILEEFVMDGEVSTASPVSESNAEIEEESIPSLPKEASLPLNADDDDVENIDALFDNLGNLKAS